MRWKSVAFLVIVTTLSAASGQALSIDRDINNVHTTTVITTDATTTSTTQDQRSDFPVIQADEVPIDQDSERSDSQSSSDDGHDRSDEDIGLGPNENNSNTSNESNNEQTSSEQETDGNGSDQEGNAEDSNEVIEENASIGDNENSTNSNENGGEESAETEQVNSNESVASRSNELETSKLGQVIETEGGPVQGYYLHGDFGIASYIDIPYGTFSGLYQEPTIADAWENVHEKMDHETRCPQIDEQGNYTGNVNCLTLSVFSPDDVENAAVLFHIYDGDFKLGSANPSIYGPQYLVTKGIILVLPNYRLGALGFLCLDNETAPGNAGLKDLTLALEWVENNIAKFGGNPSKITVSGDGRSGALAGYLALSPTSRQYVSGVITESGSVLAHWAIDRNPAETAASLREVLQQEITNEMVAEVLVTAAKDLIFKPCVESGSYAFLNETPWQILQHKDDKMEIPFIMGSANHAGLQEAMAHTSETLTELNVNFQKFLPDDLEFKNGEEKDISEEIKKQYFAENDIGLENTEQLSLCYTDAYYLGPTIRASRALVKAGAKVYVYEFSFVGELNRMLAALSVRRVVQGAARGDIVSYLFTQDGDMPSEDTDEQRMVDLLTDLWVNFLKNGVPTAEGVTWDDLSTDVGESEEEWLLINMEMAQSKGLHVNRLALWTDVYNNHFIERNKAIGFQACLSLIVTASLCYILSNN